MLSRKIIVGVSSLKPVEHLVRNSPLFSAMVKRFIAGDTLDEATEAAKVLVAEDLSVSLDLLGENVADAEEANRAKESYIEILHRIRAENLGDRVNISIKLTQCGLDISEELCEQNYYAVLEDAETDNLFVRVDMEGSAYTERTIQMVERAFQRYKNTGTVLQSMLFRTKEDVERLIQLGCRVRLVKGAYLESPEIAFPDKASVDRAFLQQGQRLLQDGNYPAFATHDEAIIKALNEFAVKENIDKSRFEYQMLYGIRRDLQQSLREEGYNVRVYVPYGESWYPYFSRRLAERPANAAFILKSLVKG
ncbi:MAG: proline dehydrogenase family protein [Fimbriimonadaceae bacterium]